MPTFPQPGSDTYIAKMMLLKTYNKLDSLREVGVPEAISHLLTFPDHYNDARFVNIHTTHSSCHMHDLVQNQLIDDDIEEGDFNSESSSLIADSAPFSIRQLCLSRAATCGVLSV
jgi:hypothetical protein